MDREKVISTFEKIISVCKEDGCDFVDLTFEDAEQILAMLKEQKSWINEIAEYQQSISGSGMHELDDYEKGKWDGLQIAWNIISEGL